MPTKMKKKTNIMQWNKVNDRKIIFGDNEMLALPQIYNLHKKSNRIPYTNGIKSEITKNCNREI